MRTLTVITGARSDYGIYRPLLRRIDSDPDLKLDLMVTGMHLSPEHGMTVRQIEADGFAIRDRIDCLMASDSPSAIAQTMGIALLGFTQAYAREAPELLIALGDRFEMFAAVAAALPMRIPVAHLHGGETTEGAIDESMRHAITKMSHVHFASTEEYRRRILQLGEAPERVFVSGAPSLDNLQDVTWLSRAELGERLGLDLAVPPLLVTFHPVTLQHERVGEQIAEVLAAIDQTGLPVVFTYPNADTNGRVIIEAIQDYVNHHERAVASVSLGTEGYFSLMRHAAAMVGNSSSGILEAASFELPVVNIGDRQRGRIAGPNVLHVDCRCNAIRDAIETATSARFRQQLRDMSNPYGDGNAAQRIVEVLKQLPLDATLFQKSFHDLPSATAGHEKSLPLGR